MQNVLDILRNGRLGYLINAALLRQVPSPDLESLVSSLLVASELAQARNTAAHLQIFRSSDQSSHAVEGRQQ